MSKRTSNVHDGDRQAKRAAASSGSGERLAPTAASPSYGTAFDARAAQPRQIPPNASIPPPAAARTVSPGPVFMPHHPQPPSAPLTGIPSVPSFDPEVRAYIDSQEPDTVIEALSMWLERDPTALQLFEAYRQRAMSMEEARRLAAPPEDFDYLYKSCWYAMNKALAGLRDSQQFERAGEPLASLCDTVAIIIEGCYDSPRYETRFSALETLRKITKSLVLCELPMVRKQLFALGAPRQLAGGMIGVLIEMDNDDKTAIKEAGLLARVEEVDKLLTANGVECYKEVLGEMKTGALQR